MDTNLKKDTADCFVPDDRSEKQALQRTTHIGIGAHPDDLEVMALDGILNCFAKEDQWFTGITVTNGAGSVRRGPYSSCSDDDIRRIRRREQRKAAEVGEYSAVYQLDYDSSVVRNASDTRPESDLQSILKEADPSTVYTHTPADRHRTHVGVATTVIRSLQSMSPDQRPERVFGCEVWRSLDWLCDEHRTVFDVSEREHLARALIGVFDSQISGGKQYDRAVEGRRRANATFHQSHEADTGTGLIYGMDLTPAVNSSETDVQTLMDEYLTSFQDDVMNSINDCTTS